MFWGRSAAIKPLLDLNLAAEDFPRENKQLDATLAHVIERLFFFICERAGYRWIKIAHPVLLPNAQRMLWIESRKSLIKSIKCTQLNLLHSNQEESSKYLAIDE
jgi:lipopolysaccharide biosynthesis protein